MKNPPKLTNFENHFPENQITELVLFHNGREKCIPGKKTGPVALDHYLFTLLIEGKCELTIDRSLYLLEKGQGFLVAPGKTYQCIADKEDPCEYLWVGFKGKDVERMLFNSRLTHGNPVYQSPNWEELFQYLQEMSEAVRKGESGALLYCQGLLLLIFAHLSRETFLFNEPHDLLKLSNIQEEYFRQSVEFIQDHIQEDVTVQTVADHLGLNRSYFSRMFKKISGLNPVDFIKNYRLDMAWHILRHTNTPIKQISLMTGFGDPSYFTKRFRTRYGVTPRSVRMEGNVISSAKEESEHMIYACFGDSITSDQVTGIGTLVAKKAGFQLLENFATGYCTCSDWHDGVRNITPLSLVTPPNTNTEDNVLSNQVRRLLWTTAPEGQPVEWFHPIDGRFSLPLELGTGLGKARPDIVYIAVSANDGNLPFNQPLDDTERVLGQSYKELTRTSIASALRWAIETIRCINPQAEIFVATPLQTYCNQPWMDDKAHLLKRKIIMEVASFCHVHLIDSFFESGFTAQVAKEHGEIHPDEEWKERIADYVSGKIREQLKPSADARKENND